MIRILPTHKPVLLLAVLLVASCSARDDVVVLKLAHALDTNHSVHQGMLHMAERLAEYSAGQMRIDIYPSGQLGAERETVELLQIGSLAMTKVSTAPLEAFVPSMKIFSIPYLFNDRDHYFRVLDSDLGKALLETGMAGFIAQSFVAVASGLPPPMILSAFMLLMTIMTNIVSNNAAAAIGTPIAVSIASQLGVAAEPFILAVLFGANMSFATPYGYQTNLLVMTAGGYKFGDFLRVGIPLTIIMWIGFSIVLPLLYEL